jgi:hypothetical protein
MLKNELELLTDDRIFQNRKVRLSLVPDRNFSELVNQSCSNARQAWAAAAFSDHNNDTIERYFNFHFRFLSGLISEKTEGRQTIAVSELCRLMDHLLSFYGKFIDQQQALPVDYFRYRLNLLQPQYFGFLDQLGKSPADEQLKACLRACLSPVYLDAEHLNPNLGELLYRESLLIALISAGDNPQSLANSSLITLLMTFNFNHFLFLDYLREKDMAMLGELPPAQRDEKLVALILAIPSNDGKEGPCFDRKWPHIGIMYKAWLNDYRALCCLTTPAPKSGFKIPLNISVKYLACMIRALYEGGFYGNVSLTTIFDHAAAVFSTKRQHQISPDSLSNAYYNIDQLSAARMIAIFNSASAFLRPYCFPA